MKLTIPELGSVIRLEKNWCFSLYDERRNETLQAAAKLYPPYRQAANGDRPWHTLSLVEREREIAKTDWVYTPHPNLNDYWSGQWSHNFVLRAETELKIDRIYIRQGQSSFSSVTFRTNCWVSQFGDPLSSAPRKLKSLRFWAKLEDVNEIEGVFVDRQEEQEVVRPEGFGDFS